MFVPLHAAPFHIVELWPYIAMALPVLFAYLMKVVNGIRKR